MPLCRSLTFLLYYRFDIADCYLVYTGATIALAVLTCRANRISGRTRFQVTNQTGHMKVQARRMGEQVAEAKRQVEEARRTYQVGAFLECAQAFQATCAARNQASNVLYARHGTGGGRARTMSEKAERTREQLEIDRCWGEYVRLIGRIGFLSAPAGEDGVEAIPRKWAVRMFGPDVANEEQGIRYWLAQSGGADRHPFLAAFLEECSADFAAASAESSDGSQKE